MNERERKKNCFRPVRPIIFIDPTCFLRIRSVTRFLRTVKLAHYHHHIVISERKIGTRGFERVLEKSIRISHWMRVTDNRIDLHYSATAC